MSAETEAARPAEAGVCLFPSDPLFVGGAEKSVRRSLAQSLEHIYERSRLADQFAASEVHGALNNVETRRLSPSFYGRYYDLVLCIEAGEDAKAAALFRELLALAAQDSALRLCPFDRRSLGPEFDRYARILDGASDGPRRFAAPAQDQWLIFERCVRDALALLAQTDADLATELETLVVEIIGAAAPEGVTAFGGASSFMMWGAVMLNVARHQTTLDALEGLVHETAHLLLFALSHQEPLTLNPIDERFPSPLRADPRPMDGVFHATFVCARLAYLYRRLTVVRPPALSGADLARVEERLASQKRLFRAGYDVVAAYAQLTPTGRAIIDAAQAHVQSDR